MRPSGIGNRLDRPVDPTSDHILGSADAEITLVEYGSYDCPACRAANEQISGIRDRLGGRMRYVFRHRPITGSEIARRAAELVERTDDPDRFWKAHVALMTRSPTLCEDDLRAVAEELDLAEGGTEQAEKAARCAKARVDADVKSAYASGAMITPTFFVNGRRYDGPWDRASLGEAMLGTLGHRVQVAALDFARWGPSAGVLLLIAAVLALAFTNSPLGPGFNAFWHQQFGLSLADSSFRTSLQHWVNDGLLTIFFLVVGLEIKREFTVGHLASPRAAALPIAAAIGGMAAPVALYVSIIPQGPWAHGWGVAMATDTAFAIALIAMMGQRVPIELRIFLTAAAIIDDIGAILVVAVFYSGDLHFGYLGVALAITVGLIVLSRSGVYRLTPYLLLGLALWAYVYASGIHATLAGVILALFIPTRPPPDLRALTAQANTIMAAEAQRGGEVLQSQPSEPALRALDAIHDRLESPAARLLRHAGARSSYLVLPLFALANAGVVVSMDTFSGHLQLMLAIMAGLVLGKPIGMLLASALAVWIGVAVKPDAYSWRQLTGAGALAGIGFTMSLFIAGRAFPAEADFAAAKIGIFVASVISAIIGVALLWSAGRVDAASPRGSVSIRTAS